MTSKDDFVKFINAQVLINTYGANYEMLDIPYDVDCPIKKGAKIIKTNMSPGGDGHTTGSTGITIGGIMDPEIGDAYLIKWNNSQHKHKNAHITLCSGNKIAVNL